MPVTERKRPSGPSATTLCSRETLDAEASLLERERAHPGVRVGDVVERHARVGQRLGDGLEQVRHLVARRPEPVGVAVEIGVRGADQREVAPRDHEDHPVVVRRRGRRRGPSCAAGGSGCPSSSAARAAAPSASPASSRSRSTHGPRAVDDDPRADGRAPAPSAGRARGRPRCRRRRARPPRPRSSCARGRRGGPRTACSRGRAARGRAGGRRSSSRRRAGPRAWMVGSSDSASTGRITRKRSVTLPGVSRS